MFVDRPQGVVKKGPHRRSDHVRRRLGSSATEWPSRARSTTRWAHGSRPRSRGQEGGMCRRRLIAAATVQRRSPTRWNDVGLQPTLSGIAVEVTHATDYLMWTSASSVRSAAARA
jgi:hypothetical protein